MTEEPKMISIGKLAERWDCSKHHLWKMAKAGKMPAFKLGARWFIQMQWVQDSEGDMGIKVTRGKSNDGCY
jgi:hypothetical protein